MANVGSAYVSLYPSMKGFAGEVSAGFASAGAGAGKSFGNGLGNGTEAGAAKAGGVLSKLGGIASVVAATATAAFAAVGGSVAALGTSALKSYANYEQLVGGIDTLFKDSSGTIQKYAADAYRTSGMSANQYMEQATSFAASLVQSCGGDTAKAAEYANMAMGDMSDNVNKMGSSMESVQYAYQGFAKQNYTMLDNLKLGYGGTKEEMERLISDANKLREAQGKTGDLTIEKYADVVEAIHTVQENMGVTGTTAQEAATTISGSVGMAKAAWENFVTGLGREDADFGKLTSDLLSAIGSVAHNVAPRVRQIAEGICTALPQALSGLRDMIAPVILDALSTAWSYAVGALSSIGVSLPSVNSDQMLAGIQSAFSAASSAVQSAVAWIQQAWAVVGPTVGQIINAFMGIGTAVSGVIGAAMPIIQTAASVIGPIVANVIAKVGELATTIATSVVPVIGRIQQVVQAVLPAVQEQFQAWGAMIQGIINAVFPFIQTVVQTVMGVISSVISVVLAAINGDWSGVLEGIKSLASTVWNGIKALITSAMGAIQGVIGSILGAVKSKWDGMWNAVSSAFSSIWNGIKNAASNGVQAVFSTVSGIKDKIVGFFAGAGEWLYNSGKAILDGLGDGIRSAISGVTGIVSGALDTIRGFFPFSPAKVGPFSGRGWVLYSGLSMGDALGKGFEKSIPGALRSVRDGMAAMSLAVSGGSLALAGAVASPASARRIASSGYENRPDQTFNIYSDDPEKVAALVAARQRRGW